LIFASPSHALSVPIRSANGKPEEKPNANIVADLRVANAALSSFQPFGRWPAIRISLRRSIPAEAGIQSSQERSLLPSQEHTSVLSSPA
jgi:hypothetical protein